MTDDREPILQAMFADAQHDLEGESFTAAVMQQSRFLKYRVLAPWVACATLILTVCVFYLAVPLQDFAQLVARGLTVRLFDPGDSWAAWLVSPVNNVGSLLVIGVKLARMLRKKIVRAS